MPGLDETFDAVFCIDYHAMAGTQNGFLDHTQSSASWFNYYLNGHRTEELGQVGTLTGRYDVPVLLVTGDQAACDEAHAFFGEIEVVSVKQAVCSLHPPVKSQPGHPGGVSTGFGVGGTHCTLPR